jgi:hypothetical protein
MTERPEPNLPKARSEIDEPRFTKSTAERLEPNLPKLRIENALPMSRACKRDIELQTLNLEPAPNAETLNELPILLKLLKLRELPKFAKFRTDNAEPNLPQLRREMQEPILT